MRIALPVALTLAAMRGGPRPHAADPAGFTRTTIDIGVHVRDVEASARFYTDVIGFTEVEGFTVAADFATTAGLTDGQPLAVRVFVLGEGESATKVKLMAVPGVRVADSDNAYVHSQLGFRYLTIFVDDTRAAMRRLQAARRGAGGRTDADRGGPRGFLPDRDPRSRRKPDRAGGPDSAPR